MSSIQTTHAYHSYEISHNKLKQSEYASHSKYCRYRCPHCKFESSAIKLKKHLQENHGIWFGLDLCCAYWEPGESGVDSAVKPLLVAAWSQPSVPIDLESSLECELSGSKDIFLDDLLFSVTKCPDCDGKMEPMIYKSHTDWICSKCKRKIVELEMDYDWL